VFTYTSTDASGNPVNVPIDVSQAGAGNNNLPYGPDPTIKQIFSSYPSPTAPIGNGYSGLLFFPSSDRENDDQFTIRIDHQLSKNNSIFARYLFDQGTASAPFHDDILPGGLGATSVTNRTQNAGVGLVSTITPTLANEFRFGGNRTNLHFNCAGQSVF